MSSYQFELAAHFSTVKTAAFWGAVQNELSECVRCTGQQPELRSVSISSSTVCSFEPGRPETEWRAEARSWPEWAEPKRRSQGCTWGATGMLCRSSPFASIHSSSLTAARAHRSSRAALLKLRRPGEKNKRYSICLLLGRLSSAELVAQESLGGRRLDKRRAGQSD